MATPQIDVQQGWSQLRPSVSFLGALSSLVYALVHAWWTLTGIPEFVRAESVFVGGWLLVCVAAAACMICIGIGTHWVAQWARVFQWLWCVIGWLCSAALAAYCLIWLPRFAQLLMVPFGETVSRNELGAFGLQVFGTTVAVLTAISTRVVLRTLRGGCPACGRVHGRPPETRDTRTTRWGYVGGYVAIIGLIIRVIPATPGVVSWLNGSRSMDNQPGGQAFLIFIALLILAGTLLPLALVHRWGRIWPPWVPLLAGRSVPRWIVLGPGMMISLGLLAYFGIGGLTAVLLGKTAGHPVAVVEIVAYVVWGIGLAVASTSYAQLTRPPCPRA